MTQTDITEGAYFHQIILLNMIFLKINYMEKENIKKGGRYIFL